MTSLRRQNRKMFEVVSINPVVVSIKLVLVQCSLTKTTVHSKNHISSIVVTE